MKPLTSNMATAINTIKANEPLIVLRIDWGVTQSVYYADKTLTIGTVNCLGKILKVGNLAIVKSQDNYGAIGHITFELDDSDLHFWNLMNSTALEGKQCTIYQYFTSDPTELLILFTGSLVAPIKWEEGQRTLSFSVFSNFNDEQIGTVITSDDESGDINNLTILNKDAVGKMIPLAFGNCLKTKALKIFQARVNQTLDNLEFDDAAFHFAFISGLGYNQQTIGIEQGEEWPQGEDILVDVNEIRLLGSMNGDQFIVKDHNIVTDLQLATTYRVEEDSDWIDPNVVWIDTDIKLTNKWVYFHDFDNGTIINYCIKQNGQKCTFQNPFLRQFPNYNLKDSDLGPLLLLMEGTPAYFCATKYNYQWPVIDVNFVFEDYVIPIGSGVIAVSDDVYFLNDLDSSDIKGLYAYRDIPNEILNAETGEYEQKGSKRTLCVIPDSYFVIDYSGPTSAIFSRKLSSYSNEYWDDGEIWVTQSSPIGPNTVDIIQWIIEHHSNLQIDFASFDYVRSKLNNYPSNFALYESKKAIEICREIAWQARCAIFIYNGFIYIKYLSESPSPIQNLVLSNIQFKTLELTFSDTERMFTRAKAKYIIPTLVEDIKSKRARESLLVYQNNIPQYGLKEITWDFFIYDNPDYVNKSMVFWGYYYSNSWKKVHLKGFLNSLNLDLFDCIQFLFARTYPIGTTSCRGIVEEWSYNPKDFTIDLVIWTPLRAGLTIEDTTFWPSDDDGIIAVDPTDGLELFDYQIPVNSHTNKKQNIWAIILSSDDEVDQNDEPTGEKTNTVTLLPNGPENNLDQTPVSGVRKLDPDSPDLLQGDTVKITYIANEQYAEALKQAVDLEIVEVVDDYLICQLPSGEEGVINVAKPYLLRQTPFDGNTVDGITYNYLGVDDRMADNGVDDPEEQVVTPDYNVGDIISAIRNARMVNVTDVDGNDVLWLDATPGRVWAVQR